MTHGNPFTMIFRDIFLYLWSKVTDFMTAFLNIDSIISFNVKIHKYFLRTIALAKILERSASNVRDGSSNPRKFWVWEKNRKSNQTVLKCDYNIN